MPDIVVVGSLNMDLVVKTRHIPMPGETVRGEDLQLIPGGKGANQAVAAARLGASVGMLGCVGGDAFGKRLLDNLTSQGIETTAIRRDLQAATGTASIVVAGDGENSIVISPGANGRLTPADVDRSEALIAGAKIILLQLEIPLTTVVHALQTATRHGVKTILNPAPAGDFPPEVYAWVDVLIPNETELAILTGRKLESFASIEAAAELLISRGPRAVVVTLGSQGAYLASREETILMPAFKVKAVDTTAAGDAFIGGLAIAWLKSGSLKQAVRYANACGALAATRFGAQPSLPYAKQVAALIEPDGV